MTTRRKAALVSGSLGKGNLGDEALLRSFLRRHAADYEGFTVLASGRTTTAGTGAQVLVTPVYTRGRRFWRGPLSRLRARRAIVRRFPGSRRDLVWLGGLLGTNELHISFRVVEATWSRTFTDRIVYYQGDVADGFERTDMGARLVSLLNARDSWVSVRSAEAARTLVDAGFRGEPRVGLDAVLYDRVAAWGLPFPRREPASDVLSIVPCNYRRDQFFPIWLAAAEAAKELGLRVRWVSVSDADDLELCRSLAAAFGGRHPGYPQEVRGGLDAERALRDAAACVATRFHALIFALTSGVPVLGVSYNVKLERLLRLVGREDCSVAPGAQYAGVGAFVERIRGLVDGHLPPKFEALAAAASAHRAALEDFGASAPGPVDIGEDDAGIVTLGAEPS